MHILCTIALLAAETWHWWKEFGQPAGKLSPEYFTKNKWLLFKDKEENNMTMILTFEVCPYMSLFRDFPLIFMFPIFHIYIDLKLYLHIPPLINMLIGHVFVLRKLVTKKQTLQMNDIFCGLLQRGVINMTPTGKRFWQMGLQALPFKTQPGHMKFFAEWTPAQSHGFLQALASIPLSSLTCVQNKVLAVSKLPCISQKH